MRKLAQNGEKMKQEGGTKRGDIRNQLLGTRKKSYVAIYILLLPVVKRHFWHYFMPNLISTAPPASPRTSLKRNVLLYQAENPPAAALD